MPVKNEGESDADEVSGAESEHSNSSQGFSDEEASDDSSDMDDVTELDNRRTECVDNINELERQFCILREQYYHARTKQVEQQLIDVENECSEEYLQPRKELDKVCRNRIEVAEVLKKFRIENIQHKYLSEEQAARQNFDSEKMIAHDIIYEDLMERIRRLEEDRHNVDISWADWSTDKRTSKVRGPGRKKAITVNGPYIVYMLNESDIIEDWTTIRKALKRVVSNATTAT